MGANDDTCMIALLKGILELATVMANLHRRCAGRPVPVWDSYITL